MLTAATSASASTIPRAWNRPDAPVSLAAATFPPFVVAGSFTLAAANPTALVPNAHFKNAVMTTLLLVLGTFSTIPASWLSLGLTACSSLLQTSGRNLKMTPGIAGSYTVTIPVGFNPAAIVDSFCCSTVSSFAHLLGSAMTTAGLSGISLIVLGLPPPAVLEASVNAVSSLASMDAGGSATGSSSSGGFAGNTVRSVVDIDQHRRETVAAVCATATSRLNSLAVFFAFRRWVLRYKTHSWQ